MIETLFLPGATGDAAFWRPVAARAEWDGTFFSWPGLGSQPARADVNSIDDLVGLVADQMRQPVAIVAQSMGGYIALKLALAFPHLVRTLVLCVTSGGVPVADLGGEDWRPDYFGAFPDAARWIADPVEDLSDRLSTVRAPTLLLWGDADPISPVTVGERLAHLLPASRLCTVPGAGHDLAQTHTAAAADEIRRHLLATS